MKYTLILLLLISAQVKGQTSTLDTAKWGKNIHYAELHVSAMGKNGHVYDMEYGVNWVKDSVTIDGDTVELMRATAKYAIMQSAQYGKAIDILHMLNLDYIASKILDEKVKQDFCNRIFSYDSIRKIY